MNGPMMRTLSVALCLVFLLGACQPRTLAGGAVDTRTLWMAQTYSGGRQCHGDEHTRPPDTRALLEAADVQALETREVPQAVCMACDICPAYAIRHYIRISVEDQEDAANAGYRSSPPPDK